MHLLRYFKLDRFILVLSFFWANHAFSQCSPQTGPPPSNLIFNTGGNGIGGALPPSTADRNWAIAIDSINGTYNPAIVMDSLPPDYYLSPWRDSRWISISRTGIHTLNRNFFYKMNFNLPCTNPCGISFDSSGSFCLNLDLLADNSIYEIYVNGIPQSGNLGNMIPVLPDPYHAVGLNVKGMISVSLCHNWKAGNNTVVIQVASSAPVTGLLVQASTVFQHELSNFVVASICKDEVYHFGNQNLTQPGFVYQTFKTASGCDSTVGLDLMVKPISYTTIDQSICEGASFMGHTISGTYIDTFKAVNGCDSLRILNLAVKQKPTPYLGVNTEFCKGDSLLLSPGKFLTYLWQDSSTKDHFVVKVPGLYSVVVSDICGTGKEEIAISEKDCLLYFPNAFTPNGDGKNDNFKILTAYQFQQYDLSVYNQWGQKVFKTTNPFEGWDGTWKGSRQQTAVYVWVCKYKKSDVATTIRGTVVLIR